ncbi:ABC transporter ATP-binding protein [Halobacillus hunanensis]|uniref:ABC transporter ATP-binding protein n=1 Tax=Halobacillus hunanensis TaxID=578214 RepID=UPI0009A74C2E|nr:ABC transporter ATP-binding protein [Halobacillus hunanensis]
MMKLFKYLKPYRIPIIVILVLTLFQALSQLFLPALMANIVDKGIVNGNISYIVKIGGLMLLVAAGGVVVSILAGFYSSKVSMGFGNVVRERMFTHIENFSLQGFDNVGSSSLITRTTNDIMQVQQVLTMMLKVLIMAPMMFIGGILIAIATDAAMSLIIIAVIPIIVAAIIVVAKKGLPLFKALQKKLDRMNLVLREGLNGIRVIRSFNRTDHEQNRFKEANLDFANTAIKVNKIMATLTPVMMFVLNFSIIAIIWFGSIRISNENLQVGELMAFIQYAMQIMFSLIMSSMMLIMIPRASVSAARINEVLDKVPDVKDPVGDKDEHLLEGVVDFDHVTFSYPGAEEPVLSNLSFSAKPGQVTAIVGGTGAGKSTLINLLPRFYDVDRGSIKIDGVDTRDILQSNLRNNISLVPQKAVLFSGTIADNIRYGKKNATDEEVRKAADDALVSDFILETKNGFDSVIAQKGANVSGGQKQRLSIARALIREANIYIFDDSFSALDFKTDAKLRASLQQETSEATVFIVAQRISTVMDADQIIVLDHGEMAGVGTHRELMENCEVYQEIVSSQLSEGETA